MSRSVVSRLHCYLVCCYDTLQTQQDSFPIIVQMRPSKLVETVEVLNHLDQNECIILVSSMSPGDKALLIESLSLRIKEFIHRNREVEDTLVSHAHSVVRRKVYLLNQQTESSHEFHPESTPSADSALTR